MADRKKWKAIVRQTKVVVPMEEELTSLSVVHETWYSDCARHFIKLLL